MNIKEAVNEHNFQIFEISFEDGSHLKIASSIGLNPADPAFTFTVRDEELKEPVNDETPGFSWEEYFGKKQDGPLKDITHQYKEVKTDESREFTSEFLAKCNEIHERLLAKTMARQSIH